MAIADIRIHTAERSLICTPVGRDADLLLDMLRRDNIDAESYENLGEARRFL